jgi:hypothetical protein
MNHPVSNLNPSVNSADSGLSSLSVDPNLGPELDKIYDIG